MFKTAEPFRRTAMLVGEQGVALLAQKRVAVFGVGGVGGFTCEALARAGVGALDLFDDDVVSESNLNRQIVALQSTVGQKKTTVMAQRIADINPACLVREHAVFYTPQNAEDYPLGAYDYIVDAVDTVSAKLEIVARAKRVGVPVISAMGAGNKLRPELFEVADIEKTSVCPLARIMRRELKKRHITKVKVVYSKEPPRVATQLPTSASGAVSTAAAMPMATNTEGTTTATSATKATAAAKGAFSPTRLGNPKTAVLGSISFVPAAAGLVLAGAVVRDLLGLQ